MSAITIENGCVHIAIAPVIKTKVQICKGKKVDTYTIIQDKERNVFPLQYGDGLYTIKIYQLIKGNQYLLSNSQTLNATNTAECWLQPSQYVWYSDEVRQLSDKINADNPKNRLSAYYNYCYKKVRYSYVKAFTHKRDTNYLPDLTEIIQKNRGICFDKASLFCALCRINNVECKLIIGYLERAYHAWCSVKVNGQWHLVDPTYGKKYHAEDYKEERYC